MASSALTMASGVVGAEGALFQGQATANQMNYKAAISQANAQLARQDANYAIGTGETEAEQAGLQYRDKIARTRTAYAAGNIDVNSGSPSRVIASQLAMGKQAQGLVRARAAKVAFGFDVEAAQDTAQASLDRMGAQTAQTAAQYTATASILGSAGQAIDQAGKGMQAGLPIWAV